MNNLFQDTTENTVSGHPFRVSQSQVAITDHENARTCQRKFSDSELGKQNSVKSSLCKCWIMSAQVFCRKEDLLWIKIWTTRKDSKFSCSNWSYRNHKKNISWELPSTTHIYRELGVKTLSLSSISAKMPDIYINCTWNRIILQGWQNIHPLLEVLSICWQHNF